MLGGAALLSALLTAPLWLLFLDAMSQAATIYDQPTAYQLQPGLFVALFDDLFSQDFTKLEYHTHPSLNFFYFAGILWLLANWKRHLSNRTAVGLAIGTLLPLAMVFGIVPPAWIMATPVLGKIQHIHNVFGCVLIVLLPVLAAIGLSDCMEAQDGERWQVLWRRMAIIGGVILLVYLGFIQAIPQDPGLGFSIEAPLHSRFFLACAPALVAAMLLVPQALRWLGEPGARRIAGIVTAAVCFVVLHFRHGMYTETKFDAYVMNPKRGDGSGRAIASRRPGATPAGGAGAGVRALLYALSRIQRSPRAGEYLRAGRIDEPPLPRILPGGSTAARPGLENPARRGEPAATPAGTRCTKSALLLPRRGSNSATGTDASGEGRSPDFSKPDRLATRLLHR